jgi:hypothetical protein
MTLLLAAPQDLGPELKKLQGEYSKASDEFRSAYRAAKTQAERDRLFRETYPDRLFLPRFQDLARRAKGGASAPAALAQVIDLAGTLSRSDLQNDALKELAASHLDALILEEVLNRIGWSPFHEGLENSVRTILAKSPHRAHQAAARIALARLLESREDAPEASTKEARRLYEDVAGNFGDTSYGRDAETRLFELDHLSIGKTAPDFDAVDQDGKAFKLSDYRGKVVVVDFWGFW